MADLPDPSTLTDEELDRILAGEEPEEEAPEATLPQPEGEEPKPGEEPEGEEPAADAEEETEEEEPAGDPEAEEEPKPVSRREQLRVEQLLKKYSKPDGTSAPAAKPEDALDYRKALDADEDIIKDLEEDRQRIRQASYNEGLQQAQNIEWRTLVKIDEPAVEADYAFLNPRDKEHFHPTLHKTMQDFYLNMVGYDPETKIASNPQLRWRDFVDAIHELSDEISQTKNQATVKNVAKQAAKTGLRPDGSAAKSLNLNKAPEDMTDEELDTFLARNIPKR